MGPTKINLFDIALEFRKVFLNYRFCIICCTIVLYKVCMIFTYVSYIKREFEFYVPPYVGKYIYSRSGLYMLMWKIPIFLFYNVEFKRKSLPVHICVPHIWEFQSSLWIGHCPHVFCLINLLCISETLFVWQIINLYFCSFRVRQYIREIGYLTDSKKVVITSIPWPTEQIYGKFFWKNSKIGPPAASKI